MIKEELNVVVVDLFFLLFVVVLNGGCDLCFCSSLFLFGLAVLA